MNGNLSEVRGVIRDIMATFTEGEFSIEARACYDLTFESDFDISDIYYVLEKYGDYLSEKELYASYKRYKKIMLEYHQNSDDEASRAKLTIVH